MELIKRALIAYITFAFTFVVLGICFIAWPHTSLITICYVIGAVILAWGVIKILNFIRNKRMIRSFSFQFNLIVGIFLSVTGFLLIINPDLLIPILPVLIGIVITADGLQKIKAGIDAKLMHHEKWWLIVIVALITIIFGISLILNPFAASNAMVVLLGVSLLVDGAQNLIVIISTFKLMSTIISNEELKNAEFVEADIPITPYNEDVQSEVIAPEDITIIDNDEEQ